MEYFHGFAVYSATNLHDFQARFTMSTSSKPKNAFHRFLIDWVLPLAIMGFIYLMGWHTEVIGRIQQVVLYTGLFQPDTEAEGVPMQVPMQVASLSSGVPMQVPMEGKVVFINFWASWCPPCVAEMPDIEKLYQQFREDDRIEFMMVNLDQDPEKRDAFLARKNFDLPFYTPMGNVPPALQSQAIPATYVVDKRGVVVMSRQGMASYTGASFISWLEERLEE
jgi:thiol-disulfide isomerase/thioredoxin